MEATSSALVNAFGLCILRGCFLPMNFGREVVLLGYWRPNVYKERGGAKEMTEGNTSQRKELLSMGHCRKSRSLVGTKSRKDILGRGNSMCERIEA